MSEVKWMKSIIIIVCDPDWVHTGTLRIIDPDSQRN